MKSLIHLIVFCFSLNLPLLEANAGTKHGGGGIGVQCGDTLRLLDLYEAEVITKQEKGPDFSTIEETFEHYARRYQYVNSTGEVEDENLLSWRKFESEYFNLITRWTEEEIPGSGEPDLPSLAGTGCRYVQIAYFRDDLNTSVSALTINRTLWNRLDHRNQVALILHEEIYRTARKFGYEDVQPIEPVEARRLTAEVMSSSRLSRRFPEAARSGSSLYCLFGSNLKEGGYKYHFYLSQNLEGGDFAVAEFEILSGQYLLNPISVSLEKIANGVQVSLLDGLLSLDSENLALVLRGNGSRLSGMIRRKDGQYLSATGTCYTR